MGRTVRATARILAGLAIAAAVLVVGLEGGASLAAYFALDLTRTDAQLDRQEFLDQLGTADGLARESSRPPPTDGPAAPFSPGEIGVPDASSRRFVEMVYGARLEIDPFFGYTLFRGAGRANNQGFPTDRPYPVQRRRGECVIGIFGGSVAMQVADSPRVLRERLEPRFQELGCDELTILPFAVGGWRQPQTFFAIATHLEDVDLVIQLDGFNDAIYLRPEITTHYPTRFPAWDIFAPLASRSSSPYRAVAFARIAILEDIARRVTSWTNRPLVRWSLSVHLAWRALRTGFENFVKPLRAEITAEAAEGWGDFEAPLGDVPARVQDYYRFYERLARAGDRVARDAGRPFLHFVQPNQYVTGSKPFSDVERRKFLANDWSGVITPAYAEFAAASERLRNVNVDSTSLGELFATTSDTVYSDSCCHFNERGLTIIEDAIADRVLASPQLDGWRAP